MLKTRGEIKVDLAKTWYAKKTYPLAKATEEIKKGGLKHSLSLPDHIKLNTDKGMEFLHKVKRMEEGKTIANPWKEVNGKSHYKITPLLKKEVNFAINLIALRHKRK